MVNTCLKFIFRVQRLLSALKIKMAEIDQVFNSK